MRLFLFSVLIVLFFSCRRKECDNGSLDAAERAWIFYSDNQRIVFFCPSSQQYDTAYATNPEFEFMSGGYSQGQDDCGPHGTENGSQWLMFNSANQDIFFSVSHDYGLNGTSASLNHNSIPETTAGSYTINGHVYDNVHILQYDTANLPGHYVWRYIVNQEFGLLQFDQKNGSSWKLER
jgi:hypothetical protein